MCYTFRVFTRVLKARCLVIGAFFLGGSWGARVLTLCNIAYLAEPDSGFSKLEAHVVAVVALRSNRRRQGPALGQTLRLLLEPLLEQKPLLRLECLARSVQESRW